MERDSSSRVLHATYQSTGQVRVTYDGLPALRLGFAWWNSKDLVFGSEPLCISKRELVPQARWKPLAFRITSPKLKGLELLEKDRCSTITDQSSVYGLELI